MLASVLVLVMGCACLGLGRRVHVSPDIDDATITAGVKTALLNDPQIGATKIDVTTVDRVVTLSGPVKSKTDEARAVQVARGVAGVTEVRSSLRIGN